MGFDQTISREIRLLLKNQDRLSQVPTLSLATTLGALSERWLDHKFLYRVNAVKRLVAYSGYSGRMTEAMLDSIFSELTAAKLKKLITSEIGDPALLDDFVTDRHSGIKRRGRGPSLILHVFAGNVPNPSILSVVFGMLLKSANICKLSSKDPGFLDIYLASVAKYAPQFKNTNYLLDSSARISGFSEAINVADLTVAYGNNDSLRAIRAQVPGGKPFIGYGHKVSFAIYLKEALQKRTAARLARKSAYDIWMLDQRGCLTLRILFLEDGGAIQARTFYDLLAQELKKIYCDGAAGKESPKNYQTWASNNLNLIQRLKKVRKENLSDLEERWRIVYDKRISVAAFLDKGRSIHIAPFTKIDGIYNSIQLFKNYLQAVALEGDTRRRERVAQTLSSLGVNRICRAGRLQHPPLTWRHDGDYNLAHWVKWTDLEG